VREQHRLQLGGGDLQPLVLDQLLHAVHDEEAAVVVRVADVPGMEPAQGVDHGGGGLGPVEIALHHLRAAHADLAFLVRAKVRARGQVHHLRFGVGNGRTHARDLDRGRAGAGGVRDRGRLGQAVTLEHAAPQTRRGGGGHRFAEGGGAREERVQAGEVVVLHDLLLGQREHERRHHVRVRDPVALQRLQALLEVEAGQRDHGGPAVQGQVHDHDHAVDVEAGQQAEHGVRPLQPVDGAGRLQDVGHQVAVREHDALGQPRGPAGVGQDHHVFARLDGHGGDLAGLEQRGARRGALRLAEHEHLAHPARLGRLPRLVQERRHRHQMARARVLELGGQLRRGVGRVDGGDPAQQRDGVEGDRVLRQIRAVDGEHVALAEAATVQAGGGAAHGLRPSGIGSVRPLGPSMKAGLSPRSAALSSRTGVSATSGMSTGGSGARTIMAASA
jgi:hypothetical protein